MLHYLMRALVHEVGKDRRVVLIIDEAQNLSAQTMEQIRLLSNLETDQQKLIQIVLSGQPELKQRLASVELRQLRQRITVRYHIPALACSEVGHYIHHRLRLAGAPADVEFTPEAVERVVTYSEGIPRKINALCDYTMLAGYVMNARQLGPVCVDRAMHQLEEGL